MDIMRKTKEEKAKATAQLKAKQLRSQAGELNSQARVLSREATASLAEGASDLAERAAEMAERLRASDAYGKALERSGELAATARQRGTSAATAARGALAEAGVDAKVADLLEILRDSENLAEARERSRAVADSALTGLGAWLGSGSIGKQLGVQRRRRRWPAWVLGILGVAAGYAIGVLTAPKRGPELRDDWSAASAATMSTATKAADRVAQDTADVSAPAAQKPLADRVRTRLGEDPRTADLPKLNVNVVEGTVFVRGAVSSDVDAEVVRGVIADVEGVTDVDMQLTTT